MGLSGFDVIYEELPHFSRYHKKILCFAGLAGMYQFGHLRSLPLFYNQKPKDLFCDKNIEAISGKFVQWNQTLDLAACQTYSKSDLTMNISTLGNALECPIEGISEAKYITAPVDLQFICEDNYKSSLFLSIALFGCTVGGFFGGAINDTYGRIRSMQVSSISMIVSLIATALSGWYKLGLIFLLGQFLMMLSSEIAFGAFISYAMEVLGPSGRSWVGVMANVTANTGMMVVTLFSFYITDWKLNVLAAAAVVLIGFLMQLLCPESPRWVHQKLPKNESEPKVINFIKSVKPDVDSLVLYQSIGDSQSKSANAAFISPAVLFSKPFLVKYSLATLLGGFTFYFSLWICIFGSGSLSGSIYMNNFIPSLVALLTSPLAAWAMDSPLGRRGAIIMYGTISGLSVFGAFLLDFFKRENSYSRWLVMFARVLVILMGSCHLNYTGELYPTEIRGNALSMRALFGSFATIITPQVLGLAKKGYWWLPNIIMGTLTFATCLAYKFMPETHKRPLAQTVIEAEALLKEAQPPLNASNRDEGKC